MYGRPHKRFILSLQVELWLSHSHLNLLGGYLYVGIFLWYPPVPEGPVPLQGQLEAGFPSISLPSSSFIVKLRKKTCVRNGDVMVEDKRVWRTQF